MDKGTNQPNVFVDPKSSESALPHFSDGTRDDLIQRRMLQAATAFWREPGNNPVSDVYGGPMLDLDNVYVWTWDARPWPDFPAKREVWSDGANHALGHWLNGRVSAASLAEAVAEICAEAGVAAVDATRLRGLVSGFVRDRTQSAREALQALMLAYGFDAHESGGALRFVMRGGGRAVELDPDALVVESDGDAPYELAARPRARRCARCG